MEEIYLKKGVLISKQDWDATIDQLKEDVLTQQEKSLEALKTEWMTAFENAILARVKSKKRIAVLLSGGVDSTLIAFILMNHKIPFTCYTVGFKDPGTKLPEDLLDARESATHFGWSLKEILLDTKQIEPLLKKAKKILGNRADPVSVGIATVVVAAEDLVKENDVIFSGLGAEEIFAGYHRHEKANKNESLEDETWRGIYNMYDRDLVRDITVVTALGISVVTPFMDMEVMKIALQMPPDVKIKDGHKKYILRVMAEEQGLPHAFVFRQKRAAQYGSRVQKAIFRLAKRSKLTENEYIDQL